MDWESQSGIPQYYFTNYSTRTSIGVQPVPDTGASTETLHVDYMAYSDVMVDSDSEPFNGISEFVAYHHALAAYAGFRMALIDGRAELATVLHQQFMGTLGVMRDVCIGRPNYKPGMQPAGP